MPASLPIVTEPLNINHITKVITSHKGLLSTQLLNNSGVINLKYDVIKLNIGNTLVIALNALANQNNVNLSSILITSVNIVLHRYSGNESVLISQAIFDGARKNRSHNELQTEVTGATKFTNLLHSINSSLNNITLVDGGIPPETGHITADDKIQLAFILKHKDVLPNNNEDLQINCDLGILLNEDGDTFEASLFYKKATIANEFAVQFSGHLLVLLEAAAARPGLKIGSYNILNNTDRKAILFDFNETITPYPKEKTLFQLFEEQVSNTPNQVALTKGAKTITYAELNKQANQLAHFLISEGVSPADNIGLLVNRDFEMIVGMLGILKAGGAYVPIDPEYPIDRQEYIYNQSLLKLVIADGNYPLKSLLESDKFKVIDAESIVSLPDTNPGLIINSEQLAYTIYTSGSTGRPKGVMIEHHSAVNLVKWVNNEYRVGTDDSLLFITSMCFDLSVYDIFGMLACGGNLVIAEKSEIQDVQVLSKMLVNNNVTFWDSVPTTMDYLVKTLEMENPEYRHQGLKTVFLSGDWIPVNLPDRIKKFFPNTKVICLGGATEATVWSNFFEHKQTLAHWNSIPYGKPLANNFFYILNEQLQPVPIGTVGDLYIGGVGVARGYANDPEKTQRQFVPNPFTTECGGMMYKTGDLGRMMFDYNMEFIGRKDNQVKINGFRVELGEIESVLNNSGLVSVAVVLAKNDAANNKRLIAYTVPGEPKAATEALVLYLKKTLPDYMIPSVWVELGQLPLTSNGKIDRNTLQALNDLNTSTTILALPETETEKTLLSIWQEYFKKDALDVNSNFFEAGGHSLMAVQILSRLKKVLRKNYQLSILYKYPTIRSLAQHIDKEYNDYNFKSLVPIKPTGTKDPLYVIHGDGLNVLNFHQLAKHVDAEQPVYGLQALGLNGTDEPVDSLPVIAYHYMQEILQHNSEGPYLLAGYSSGGYVAMEIRKQMMAIGKQVKMLIIFDTDAEKTEYKDWLSLLPKKAKRHLPRLFLAFKMSVSQLFQGQKMLSIKPFQQKESRSFYKLINKIKSKHVTAFRNYTLEPFDGRLHLYKAKVSVHYVEYGKLLGWEKFALQGVELFEIPGDHFSMLLPPHVAVFAEVLQSNLDRLS